VIEATEEAVYNSMLRAKTMTAHGHTVEALPIEKTTEILRKYGVIKWTANDFDSCQTGELQQAPSPRTVASDQQRLCTTARAACPNAQG
jgi:hypothetical protein